MATGAPPATDHLTLTLLVTLGIAVLSTVSALSGVALSAWLESRREERRRTYEKSIRFHDERASAYVEYLRAVASLCAAASVWTETEVLGGLIYSPRFAATLGPYSEALSRMRLLASRAVLEEAAALHLCVDSLTSGAHNSISDVSRVHSILGESKEYRVRLERAMQAELGIE